jgi:hypothetical protein
LNDRRGDEFGFYVCLELLEDRKGGGDFLPITIGFELVFCGFLYFIPCVLSDEDERSLFIGYAVKGVSEVF